MTPSDLVEILELLTTKQKTPDESMKEFNAVMAWFHGLNGQGKKIALEELQKLHEGTTTPEEREAIEKRYQQILNPKSHD